LAIEHLRDTLTKQNLWLYILTFLDKHQASPSEIKDGVQSIFNFSPAAITFYTVLYRLRREELVEKIDNSFRSKYRLTEKGRQALKEGIELLSETASGLSN
jgi:DNA-binding PadR family transcriptional regulator